MYNDWSGIVESGDCPEDVAGDPYVGGDVVTDTDEYGPDSRAG